MDNYIRTSLKIALPIPLSVCPAPKRNIAQNTDYVPSGYKCWERVDSWGKKWESAQKKNHSADQHY